MRCPACGNEVEDRRWFCPGCDAPLHKDEEIVPPGMPEAPATEEHGRIPVEFDIHRRVRRAWIIRILITVLILAVLFAVLLLLARSSKSEGRPMGTEVAVHCVLPAVNPGNAARGLTPDVHLRVCVNAERPTAGAVSPWIISVDIKKPANIDLSSIDATRMTGDLADCGQASAPGDGGDREDSR